MKKVISPDDNIVTKQTLGYLEYAPVINVNFVMPNDSIEEKSLKIYADKKMRQSIVNNLLQGKLVINSVGSYVVLKSKEKCGVKIKTGVRGDKSAPIIVNMVEINTEEIKEYASQPQEIQRTAKEQADYLFGMLIAQAGGKEWIKEQTWSARGADIIHNNNKGNVAYTRLDIMLSRSLRIYQQFNSNKQEDKSAE